MQNPPAQNFQQPAPQPQPVEPNYNQPYTPPAQSNYNQPYAPPPQPAEPSFNPPQPSAAPTPFQPTQQLDNYNSQPSEEFPVDYLNQIAPTTRQRRGPSKLILIIAALVAVVAVVALLGSVLSGEKEPDYLEQIGLINGRLDSLTKVSTDNQKNLKAGVMRVGNKNLTTFLLTARADLDKAGNKAGLSKTKNIKASKLAVDEEKAHLIELNQKFEDAALSGKIDRTYSREMNYELSILLNMLNVLKTKTSSKILRDYVGETNEKLVITQKIFYEFTDY